MLNDDEKAITRLYDKLQKLHKAKLVFTTIGIALLLPGIILIAFFNSSLGILMIMVGLIAIAIAIILGSQCQHTAGVIYQNSDQYEIDMENKHLREDEIRAAQHPQCPACHGYNTKRISTTKRVVSTSLIGLASSTIGKQYECLDCQHKW